MTETVSSLALFCGVCLGLWVAAALARAAMTLGSRLLDAISTSVHAVGEAAGIAAAWPFERCAEHLDRWASRSVAWRERRRAWRAGFKDRSWDEFQRERPDRPTARNELADALGLLALEEPFTRADLDARFKRTMAAVHPDKGGSTHLARLTNDARALILRTKGWKR